MMMVLENVGRDVTLREFVKSFEEGVAINTFFDWFCTDAELGGKTRKLAKKIVRIAKSSKVNLDKHYVIMKNNCPMYGKLYDDFRICEVGDDGDVVFCVTPSSGHDSVKGEASVWGKENAFSEALMTGTMDEVYKWFGV